MRVVDDTVYKTAAERTDPVGGAFTLHDEYQALTAMYEAGVSIPEPRSYEEEREEYSMEHIPGATVQELDTVYPGLTDADRRQIAARLEADLDRMHEEGLPHGDICTSNIIVDSDRQPYYIDPVGFSHGHPEAEQVMERDRQNLAYITGRFLR